MRRLVKRTPLFEPLMYDVMQYSDAVPAAIDAWVRHKFVYAEDVPIEVIRTPENMIQTISMNGYFIGDCDDASIMVCYIAQGFNVPCRMIAIRDSILDSNFNHVYAQVFYDGQWITIDPTVPSNTRIFDVERIEVNI